MRISRTHVALAAIAASLALLAYALLGSSDEDRIHARLKELANAVETKEGENFIFRTARLNGVFKEALEPNATLTAPELPTTTGTQQLASLGGQAANFATEFRVSVGETDIRIDARSARGFGVTSPVASGRAPARDAPRAFPFEQVRQRLAGGVD